MLIANTWCDVFTAFGTVGSVIVALWFAYKANTPQLKIGADYIFFSDYPDLKDIMCLSCVNTGKLPVIISHFEIKNLCGKKLLITRNSEQLPFIFDQLPKELQFGGQVNIIVYKDELLQVIAKNCCLYKWMSRFKFLVKIRVKWFCSVIATTSVGNFRGELSCGLIEEIASICFSTLK